MQIGALKTSLLVLTAGFVFLAPISECAGFEKPVSCAGEVFQKALADLNVTGNTDGPLQQLGNQAMANRGTNSLYQIKTAAQDAGLHVRAIRMDLRNLHLLKGKGVFIANMTGNHHFCLIQSADSENVTIYIPEVRHPQVKMPISFVKREWDSVVLLISKESVDLRPYRQAVRPVSDRYLKTIFGGANCGNASGASPGGIPVGNGAGNTGSAPSGTAPEDVTSKEPVVIRNGNLFLDVNDISVPTRSLPLSLVRHYNAQVVSQVADWQPEPGAGSWAIENGEYSGQGDRSVSTENHKDFTLELDMKTVQPGANYPWETGWVNFRYVPNATDPRKVQDGYYFVMQTDGKIELAKWRNGIQSFLYNKPTAYRPVNMNRIKIEAVGPTIKIYVNGVLEMNITDSTDPVLAEGKIALESFYSHAHFDNVKITDGGHVHSYDFSTDDNEFIFGYGWTHSYFLKVNDYGDHLTLIRENGHKNHYKPTVTAGVYAGVVPTYDKLTKDAQGFSLKTKYGTHYRFNLAGQLIYIEDRNLNRTTLTYALVGGKSLLASVTEPAGRKLLFTYGANGLVSKVTDPQGNFFQYFYDAAGHLIRVLDRNLNQTLYAYDGVTHNLTQLTDPAGYVFKYAFLYNDRVTMQTDPKGAVTTFDYFWSTVHVINGRGEVYMYNFDANLHLQSLADPLNKIQRMVNDAGGNTLEAYDKNNNKSVFTYDAMGNRTSAADPLGNTNAVTYDAVFNQPKTLTDAKGSVTSLTYDAKGNLLQAVDPLTGTLRMTHNAFGQPLTVTDALGKITTFTYDANGNVATSKDPLGNTTTFAYDVLGRLTRVTNPLLGITDTTYDKNGNALTVKDPLSNVTTFTYTKKDRVATVKDPLLNVTTFTYDCFGNRTSAVDALGKTTLFTYDTLNQMHLNQANLTQLKDASGNLTNYAYDALDRPTQTTDALGNVHKFFYDNQGNLVSRTDAKLQTINYQYDSLNRLKKTIYPDAKSFELTYDAVGNIASLQDWNGTLQFAYDKLGRVTAKTYPDLTRLDYTYDLAGNRTSLNIPGYGKILYTYDAANRLMKTTTPDSRVATFTYDNLSRRTKLVYPNGSAASYTYDAASRLQQVLNTDKNLVNVSKAGYVYDAASRRTRVDYLNGSVTFTYDKLSQLLKEQGTLAGLAHSVAYTYDALGNRMTALDAGSTTTTYTNNTLNQATKTVKGTSTVLYSYDKNGNMVKRESPGVTDSQKGYTYDFENRLTHYAGGFSAPGSADYAYNALGERVSKLISGQTTKYYYDGADLVLEKKGTVATAYVPGPRIDEILTDSRKYSYHTDGQGSVLNLTDSLGVKSNTYSYTAFGTTKAQTGTAINPWLYTGRQYDSESGLYFNRNRYYNPGLGRFMTQDPVGLKAGINYYAYVGNDPVNYVDPYGTLRLPPWVTIPVTLGGIVGGILFPDDGVLGGGKAAGPRRPPITRPVPKPTGEVGQGGKGKDGDGSGTDKTSGEKKSDGIDTTK